MRIYEIFESTTTLPDKVYHGTASANLSNIMKHGLKPRLNKWFYSNSYQNPGAPRYRLQPGEKMKDLADLSTTSDFERAKEYAEQGGSTGWGNVPGVVLAFKPLPSDVIEFEGFDTTELVFKNAIAPERLEIVWPERLMNKKPAMLDKAAEKKMYSANKTAQVKEINKKLKAANSGFRIKSTSPHTMRAKVVFDSKTPLTYINKRSGELMSDQGPWNLVNTDIDSQEFQNFLKQELSKPLNTQKYYVMTNYVNSLFPRSYN